MRNDELKQQADDAWTHVNVDMNRVNLDQTWQGVNQGIKRRRQVRQAGLAIAVPALLLLVSWALFWRPDASSISTPEQQPSIASTPNVIVAATTLGDGSTITPLGPDLKLLREPATPTQTSFTLKRGQAQFQVTKNSKRAFTVTSGDVLVTVIGTRFDVESREQGAAYVKVHEGKVRVSVGKQEWFLVKGDEGVYPPKLTAKEPEAPSPKPPAKDPTTPEKVKPIKGKSWRALAKRGEFEKASKLLMKREAVVRDEVEDLMLAADAMRLSKKPKRAVRYLDKVLKRHKKDPRAASAAFTKGRLLMRTLGRPAQAARSFALVPKLLPSSPLVDNAMAREVEAWAKAKQSGKAKAAATRYMTRFPQGKRLNEVKRFGDLP